MERIGEMEDGGQDGGRLKSPARDIISIFNALIYSHRQIFGILQKRRPMTYHLMHSRHQMQHTRRNVLRNAFRLEHDLRKSLMIG